MEEKAQENSLSKHVTPATSAVVGTSLVVLLVELARTGALAQYGAVLAPVFSWGPGVLILFGFLWMARTYGPPLIAAQQDAARNMGELSATIRGSLEREEDVRMAIRTLASEVRGMRSEFMCLGSICPLKKEGSAAEALRKLEVRSQESEARSQK